VSTNGYWWDDERDWCVCVCVCVVGVVCSVQDGSYLFDDTDRTFTPSMRNWNHIIGKENENLPERIEIVEKQRRERECGWVEKKETAAVWWERECVLCVRRMSHWTNHPSGPRTSPVKRSEVIFALIW
jgi:hypothetical protein